MGTLRKRKNGWYAETCVNGRRKGKSHATKLEATTWITFIENGTILTNNKTFADLLKRYLKDVSIKKRGYKWESDRIGAILRDNLADVKLSQLDKSHIAEWRDRRLKSVKPATVKREWNLLNHAFNISINEWGWMNENPMKSVKCPVSSPPRTRRISQEEIDRLLLACGYPSDTIQSRVGDCLLFAIETAMRASEICNLTWDHVHDKYVHLPKTKNGNPRDVPLSTQAREIIESQDRDNKTVFNITSSQLSSHFRKAKARCMLDDLHFHDSRREALTRLSEKFNLMQLAKISGHKDLRILQEVYYTPSINDLADKLD